MPNKFWSRGIRNLHKILILLYWILMSRLGISFPKYLHVIFSCLSTVVWINIWKELQSWLLTSYTNDSMFHRWAGFCCLQKAWLLFLKAWHVWTDQLRLLIKIDNKVDVVAFNSSFLQWLDVVFPLNHEL
jgi:hypothetical protein